MEPLIGALKYARGFGLVSNADCLADYLPIDGKFFLGNALSKVAVAVLIRRLSHFDSLEEILLAQTAHSHKSFPKSTRLEVFKLSFLLREVEFKERGFVVGGIAVNFAIIANEHVRDFIHPQNRRGVLFDGQGNFAIGGLGV